MSKTTYQQYKEKRQAEVNALPIFYAFSNKQFAEEMEKRGLTANDTDKIYKIGGTGGFYLKSDAHIIHEFLDRPDPLESLMQNPEFAESAFYYEMGNHEYHINHYQGDWDVCSCFGKCDFSDDKSYEDYLREMGYSDSIISAYRKARRKFLNDAIKNDWY